MPTFSNRTNDNAYRIRRLTGLVAGRSVGERRQQMRQLLDLSLTPPGGRTVFMGDFNEWWPWGQPLRWLHAEFDRLPAPASFPSYWPTFALDRICLHGHQRLLALEVNTSLRMRRASDHLPLKAVVEW